ncbi:MAG: PIN domain-containing protein [Nitriliruptorales bacterium]|nr:PIN domain-containing protein [Nitriliruptorales bacterium]
MALTVLDAGVLIGVLDSDDPHHQPAVDVLRRLLDAGDLLVVPASVYAEVLVGPFRRGEDAEVGSFLHDIGADIAPGTRDVARSAARLRAAHGPKLRLPDALVIATGETLGADRVVTTDTRWPRRLPVRIEVV